MKKLIFWALAALLIVPVSCGKGGGSDSSWKEPSTKEQAQLITFKEPVPVGAYKVHTIEFTEGSRYIVTYNAQENGTKGSLGPNALFGSFSYSAGAFLLSGFGRVVIDGTQVTITTETAGGSPITGEASIKPTYTNSVPQNNLCRTWKMGTVIIGVSGGDFGQAGVEKRFDNGLNMTEIGNWAKTYAHISDEDLASLAKYTVKELSVTGNGSILVAFTGADPILGSYRLSGEGISFSFDPKDITFISGSFSGKVSFTSTTCTITAEATAKYNGVSYKASIETTLTEVK